MNFGLTCTPLSNDQKKRSRQVLEHRAASVHNHPAREDSNE
jgi:hypothetical protein